MLIGAIMCMVLIQNTAYAQKNKDGTYSTVENPSNPENGREHLYAYLAKEMKYPKQARKAGIEGVVYIEFIVNKLGKVISPKVIKGIGAGCDSEALRAFIEYPEKWIPAKHEGNVVKQKMVLPVTFKLGKDKIKKDEKS